MKDLKLRVAGWSDRPKPTSPLTCPHGQDVRVPCVECETKKASVA